MGLLGYENQKGAPMAADVMSAYVISAYVISGCIPKELMV